MKKRESLVGHVLINNFKIIITVVAIAVIAFFITLCSTYRTRLLDDAKSQLTDTSHNFMFEIENAIRSTDTLVRNERIIEGLNTDFAMNYMVIDFVDDLTSFISDIMDTNVPGTDSVIIYSRNPTLINSGYIRSSSLLQEFESIKRYADTGMRLFKWRSTIDTDSAGRSYLTLYRYIPMKYDCVAEVKIFIDDIYPENNVYNIKLSTDFFEHETQDSLTLKQSLMDDFVLTGHVDKKLLSSQYLRYLLMIALCALSFLAITYILIDRSAKKSMKDILLLISKLESGDILTFDDNERWNEIAIIKNKMAELSEQLRIISVREYEHELRRKKLEVELLNSKINPHLIYNSLSVIKLAAFREKCLGVCEAADILVNYYRLVLNKGEDIITIALELEYLEKYIGIYRISKKKEYELEYDICEEAMDIEIPHMLLQPILENSLIHGLNHSKNPVISISASCEEDKVVIEIGDNGVGMPKDREEAINNRESLGYGLKSVIQRADFYYKGDFDFTLESEQGKGTIARLALSKKIKRRI